jgi:hypothetical protein
MVFVMIGKGNKTLEMVIRNNGIEEVVGSIPSGSTKLLLVFAAFLASRSVPDISGISRVLRQKARVRDSKIGDFVRQFGESL